MSFMIGDESDVGEFILQIIYDSISNTRSIREIIIVIEVTVRRYKSDDVK
jgi:hypothetical protein